MIKKKVIAVIAALFVLFAMCACGTKKTADNVDSETTDGSTSLADADDTTLAFFKTDEEVFETKTPYCSIMYPTKWRDSVAVNVSETDSGCSVAFSALLDDTDVPLYTIVIEVESEGYLLGTVDTSDGTKNVYLIDMYDSETAGALTEESEEKYLQMCEDVNVIISKLVYDSGMQFS